MKKPRSLKKLYEILLKEYERYDKKREYARCLCEFITFLKFHEIISPEEYTKLFHHFITQYPLVEDIGGMVISKGNIEDNFWFKPGEYSKREELLKAIIKSL